MASPLMPSAGITEDPADFPFHETLENEFADRGHAVVPPP